MLIELQIFHTDHYLLIQNYSNVAALIFKLNVIVVQS